MINISIKELLFIIKEDFRRYENGSYKIIKFFIYGILGIGPYQAVLIYRIAFFFRVNKIPFLHSILTKLNLILNSIEISAYCKIGPGLFIAHTTGIVIGKNAVLGKNSTIFHNVTIGARTPFDGIEAMPVIGDNVKIYTGAKILGDIKVEDFCRIGANIVLMQSLKKGSTIILNKENYFMS